MGQDVLPLFYWDKGFFKQVEYACGGFLGVHEETPRGKNRQWARVLIKTNRRKVLGSLQVAVGQSCPAVHLCWELPLLGPQMCPCKEWLEVKKKVRGGFTHIWERGFFRPATEGRRW